MSVAAHSPVLIGHEEAARQITEAFASGRMHHAWLITGIEGIGKTRLAWHMANHVLSNGRNPIGRFDAQDAVTKLMQAEAHPDLLVVRRAVDERTGELKNTIVIEDALKVAGFLRMTASHGGWRVVIVEDAHVMTRNAENAILKILEEPPPRTLILMTATTAGAMLPTIRSRCRVLPLQPLEPAAVKAVVSRAAEELDGEALDRLIGLSGGSAGFALKMARAEAMPLYEEMARLMDAPPPVDMPRLHKLADQISRKADAQSFEVLRALMLDRLRREAVVIAEKDGQAGEALRLLDDVTEIFDKAEHSNLDKKLAFISAMQRVVMGK